MMGKILYSALCALAVAVIVVVFALAGFVLWLVFFQSAACLLFEPEVMRQGVCTDDAPLRELFEKFIRWSPWD